VRIFNKARAKRVKRVKRIEWNNVSLVVALMLVFQPKGFLASLAHLQFPLFSIIPAKPPHKLSSSPTSCTSPEPPHSATRPLVIPFAASSRAAPEVSAAFAGRTPRSRTICSAGCRLIGHRRPQSWSKQPSNLTHGEVQGLGGPATITKPGDVSVSCLGGWVGGWVGGWMGGWLCITHLQPPDVHGEVEIRS